ncbi:hypothetical protein GCM10009804_10950 [Kribbella hippodromi]|uniref:Aspartate racemase n=1 Tax=Kribbella hippodromi TaxID=434347 RepID=A0ABP4N5P0_9ACTN
MRTLGIVAHSVPGAASCFQTFCELGMDRLGQHQHPPAVMDCVPMGASMPYWESGDHQAIRAILAGSAERLAKIGAEFFVCPDNTAHLALEAAGPPLAIPGLHIAEVVARRAADSGYRQVAVLGTNWTMESDLYPQAMAAHGLRTWIPAAHERELIQATTFSELVHGRFTDSARQLFGGIIESSQREGCDAVALVCTEFPLLVTPDVSSLPILNSTALLAEAALEVAIGSRPQATWHGGPTGL